MKEKNLNEKIGNIRQIKIANWIKLNNMNKVRISKISYLYKEG